MRHLQGQQLDAVRASKQATKWCFYLTGSSVGPEALNGAGETLLATGHHQEARTCLTEALTLAEQTGYRYQQARAHRALAATCHAAGQLEQASQHRQHALDTYTDLGVPEAAQMRASAVTTPQ